MNDTDLNILAIDTAASVFSVALGTAGGHWYFEADAGPLHSQLLMEIIDTLFKKAGLKPAELSRVACMKGPGSFTGLRIGLSCAKGLALSLGIPCAAVSTLECMAYPYSAYPGLVLPAIDAKKNSWFCALFSGGARITADMDAHAEAIADVIIASISKQNPEGKPCHVLLAGPDAERLHGELSGYERLNENAALSVAPCRRSGSARELLAIAQLPIAKRENIFDSERMDFNWGPEYIRKSDAEINAGK